MVIGLSISRDRLIQLKYKLANHPCCVRSDLDANYCDCLGQPRVEILVNKVLPEVTKFIDTKIAKTISVEH